MFRKNQTPQKKTFNLTNQEIMNDLDKFKYPDEKKKLFTSLDENLPNEKQYTDIKNFLKGTKELEQILECLKTKANEIKMLEEELQLSVETVRRKAEEVQEENVERNN